MANSHGGKRETKLISYHGELYSMNQLGQILGLNPSSISHYFKRGLTTGEAIEEKLNRPKSQSGNRFNPTVIRFAGREMTIKEVSDITGLHAATIYKAVQEGRAIESIIQKAPRDKLIAHWEKNHKYSDLPTEEELFLDWIHFRGEWDEVGRLASLSGRGHEWAKKQIAIFEEKLKKRQGVKYVPVKRKRKSNKKETY